MVFAGLVWSIICYYQKPFQIRLKMITGIFAKMFKSGTLPAKGRLKFRDLMRHI